MSWAENNGLGNRIKSFTLPLILCGPMLRRVEPHSVSVFVALSHPREVTLTLYGGVSKLEVSKQEGFVGTARTDSLGRYLHVVVVTAKVSLPPSVDLLKPRELYGYDLSFKPIDQPDPDEPGAADSTLADHGLLSGRLPLGYANSNLPSFSLPPADLNKLRIIHGSCRQPHAEGFDALAALDQVIQASFTRPDDRPHQLFLTGDQIYADGVASALLLMLTDAGNALLAGVDAVGTPVWEEQLPPNNQTPSQLRPRARGDLVHQDGGLTDGTSHLLSLGEFYAMYLFVWSPVLWPIIFPTYEEVFTDESQDRQSEEDFLSEIGHLERFARSLPQARRALANVPTYMIFDDHEISDSWYLNRKWSTQALSKPLGRRIIQNGLLAYAVFQAWGNTPSQFEASNSKGGELLKQASQWQGGNGANDADHEEQIRRRLLPKLSADNKPVLLANDFHRMDRRAEALDWHYTVPGANYEVIVLDARTWRGDFGAAAGFSALITKEGLQEQITGQQPNNVELTLVISSLPVLAVPQELAYQRGDFPTRKDIYQRDAEVWELELKAFDLLLARIAGRAPLVTGNQKRQGRVILLSGDVHYGYAARLQYWADQPFEVQPTVKAELIAAQLVSSPLNKSSKKLGKIEKVFDPNFHTEGYERGDRLPDTIKGAGRENPSAGEVTVGERRDDTADSISVTTDWTASGNPISVRALENSGLTSVSTYSVTKPMDWLYRIDFILSEQIERDFQACPVRPVSDGENPAEHLDRFLCMTANHKDFARKWGNGKEIVKKNNFGEIRFQWGDAQTSLSSSIVLKDESISVNDVSRFPLPPFFVLIETEILEVKEVELSSNTFTKVRRNVGNDDSVLAGIHGAGARVELLNTAIQNLWWRLFVDGQLLPFLPLTQYVVSLHSDDPRYPKLTLPLEP